MHLFAVFKCLEDVWLKSSNSAFHAILDHLTYSCARDLNWVRNGYKTETDWRTTEDHIRCSRENANLFCLLILFYSFLFWLILLFFFLIIYLVIICKSFIILLKFYKSMSNYRLTWVMVSSKSVVSFCYLN